VLKKRILPLIGFTVVLGILGWGTVAAQIKIGYVDSQKILSAFPPALDAQKKLEVESNKWGQELQKMQEDLKTLQNQLDQQSLLLSEAKKKEKAQQLQDLAIKIQQYQNEKWGNNGEFFKRRGELLQPVLDQINNAINKVGDEEAYDFIFDSVAGNVLFAKDKYNLTDKILKELEKASPASTSKTTGK